MYNDENDYELLYLISESNEEAKEVFFEKYKPTVQSYVLKYFPFIKNKGYEMNDLYQEGMLGLNRAIHDLKNKRMSNLIHLQLFVLKDKYYLL